MGASALARDISGAYPGKVVGEHVAGVPVLRVCDVAVRVVRFPRECLHVWWRPRSSKPVEGLNKALCGFDSHTLPYNPEGHWPSGLLHEVLIFAQVSRGSATLQSDRQPAPASPCRVSRGCP